MCSIFEPERAKERVAWTKTAALVDTIAAHFKDADPDQRRAFLQQFTNFDHAAAAAAQSFHNNNNNNAWYVLYYNYFSLDLSLFLQFLLLYIIFFLLNYHWSDDVGKLKFVWYLAICVNMFVDDALCFNL